MSSPLHDSWELAIRELDAAAAPRPLRTALFARATRALAHAIRHSNAHYLSEVACAPSDLDLVLAVLSGFFETEPPADRALHDARLRGIQLKRKLLEDEGGTLTAQQVAELLGMSRQAVHKRRLAGHLLAVEVGKRGYLFPAWQFHGTGLLPHLEEVLDVLNGQENDPWDSVAFFLRPNGAMGGRIPLDELRGGNLDGVLRAARLFLEQSAE